MACPEAMSAPASSPPVICAHARPLILPWHCPQPGWRPTQSRHEQRPRAGLAIARALRRRTQRLSTRVATAARFRLARQAPTQHRRVAAPPRTLRPPRPRPRLLLLRDDSSSSRWAHRAGRAGKRLRRTPFAAFSSGLRVRLGSQRPLPRSGDGSSRCERRRAAF